MVCLVSNLDNRQQSWKLPPPLDQPDALTQINRLTIFAPVTQSPQRLHPPRDSGTPRNQLSTLHHPRIPILLDGLTKVVLRPIRLPSALVSSVSKRSPGKRFPRPVVRTLAAGMRATLCPKQRGLEDRGPHKWIIPRGVLPVVSGQRDTSVASGDFIPVLLTLITSAMDSSGSLGISSLSGRLHAWGSSPPPYTYINPAAPHSSLELHIQQTSDFSSAGTFAPGPPKAHLTLIPGTHLSTSLCPHACPAR